MAGRFVRDSKLRNVFGQQFKKDQCFDSIRVSKNNNTQMFCAVNPKFMAVVTHAAGGGSFLVLPHNKTGRLDVNHPLVSGHKAPVIDLAWSPFDDTMIASCDENGNIMIWQIPDEGLTENMEVPLVCLDIHQKRCSLIKWHPLAENVLLSAGVDMKMYVWNLDDGESVVEVDLPDVVQDMCWSPDGKTFATASKDKKVRIYTGRTGKLEKELPGHDSPREMRVALLKDDRLLSTGFARDSRREYKLWNLKNINEPMYHDSLDQTNAPLTIFYDPDISMVYLVGKGDSVFRYYEINNEEPYIHYISTYQSSQPQRGMGYMPKRGCNVNACEVARMYKVTVGSGAVGSVEPISMIVPRKSELYQADIFPDTAANEPSVTADEWFQGTDGKPKTMSMKQFFVEKDSSSSGKTGLGGLKKGGLKKGSTSAASAPAKKEEPKASPISSVKAPVAKVSTPASNHNNPPASTPSEPPAPKASAPKAQSKEPSEPQSKTKSATPKESTTPQGGKTKTPPVLDGKMLVSDILLDVRNLRNTVSKHEASIAALEELQLVFIFAFLDCLFVCLFVRFFLCFVCCNIFVCLLLAFLAVSSTTDMNYSSIFSVAVGNDVNQL